MEQKRKDYLMKMMDDIHDLNHKRYTLQVCNEKFVFDGKILAFSRKALIGT